MEKEEKTQKNKLIIIFGVVALALIAIGIWWFLFRKVEVTLDYSNKKEEKILIQINKKIDKKVIKEDKLSENFIGWFQVIEVKDGKEVLAKQKFDFDKKISKKIKLNALYSEEGMITIKFDSNGGTKVEDMFIKKDEELVLPENPTKEGYTFGCWKDKNEVPISTGALLADDITLYAYWDKNEEESKSNDSNKSTNTEKNNSTTTTTKKSVETTTTTTTSRKVVEEKPIIYKCETGYTLDGTKCVKTTSSRTVCPEGTFTYGRSQCITINGTVRRNSNKVCDTKTVNYGRGHTEQVQGKLVQYGPYYCYYGQVTDSTENNETTCTNRGHNWSNPEKKCYYIIDQDYTSSCESGYALINNPNEYSGVNGLNGGCFPISNRAVTCPSGYNYTVYQGSRVCKMEINATRVN